MPEIPAASEFSVIWRKSLHVVQPATVVRWHRQGFRYYWRWKSRRLGRPKIDPQIRHLIQRILSDYVDYYNGDRTHLSLSKDTPDGRADQSFDEGRVVALKRVGGLHHLYEKIAA